MAITTKNTWQIFAIKGASSNIWYWQIKNLITGNIHQRPVANTDLDVEINSSTDYNFIWDKNGLNPININIIDVEYIVNGSGTPNYGSASTDLASILALI